MLKDPKINKAFDINYNFTQNSCGDIVAITCIAMTSGSRFSTNLENSAQLFLTLSSKLLAFHVKNFKGSLFVVTLFCSSVVAEAFSFAFSESFTGDEEEEEEEEEERVGFLKAPSFSTGLKNLFILRCCFSLRKMEKQSTRSRTQNSFSFLTKTLILCCCSLS